MAEITWSGLEELYDALRTLPADLTAEAADIIDNRAELAKSAIIQSYPRRTGDLRDHVTIETKTVGAFGIAVTVRNTSKLAWIVENGSQARHYITVNGVTHLTGKMPPGHFFIPPAERHRRAMYGELKDMLTRHGLLVSGDV